MNYYNEFDLFAAEWLRNLITAGLIPAGHVDTRSIKEVSDNDLKGFVQHHFFAGIGGWSLALRLAGWPDDRPVTTGSCPCQSFSCAGKGEGQADERHLWPEMFRLVREYHPDVIIGEQVKDAIGHGWLDGVSADLEGTGYAIGAIVLGAHSAGAPHRRQRLFWVADSGQSERRWREQSSGEYRRAFHAANGGGVDELADSTSERFGEARATKSDRWRTGSGHSQHAGRESVAGCDNVRERLGNSTFGRLAIHGSTSGIGGHVEQPGESHLADAVAQGDGVSKGLQGHAGHGGNGNEPRRFGAIAAGSITAASPIDFMGNAPISGIGTFDGQPGSSNGRSQSTGRSGAWNDFIILPCRDNKSRRASAEPSAFPLAHGIPSKRKDGRLGYVLSRLVELGHDPKVARRILAGAKANRVGRLKGYGNAIVPEVAAEFIAACMEAFSEEVAQR